MNVIVISLLLVLPMFVDLTCLWAPRNLPVPPVIGTTTVGLLEKISFAFSASSIDPPMAIWPSHVAAPFMGPVSAVKVHTRWSLAIHVLAWCLWVPT